MVRYTQLAGRLPAFAGMNVQARLPDHYYKHLMELRRPGPRIHDEPQPAEILDYKLADRETLRIKRVPDTPANVIYPKEADTGIWGGEGVVKGFYKYRTFYGRYWCRLFMPLLYNSQVYSDVLDVYLKLQVNERALELFDKANGFDNYILRTPVHEFKSNLALKLRRKMLLSLVKEDYYPNDAERHAYIKEKYKDCIIPEEEADWIGLTEEEALEKLKLQESKENPILPMKYAFKKELVQVLTHRQEKGLLTVQKPESSLRSSISSFFSPIFRRTGKSSSQQSMQ